MARGSIISRAGRALLHRTRDQTAAMWASMKGRTIRQAVYGGVKRRMEAAGVELPHVRQEDFLGSQHIRARLGEVDLMGNLNKYVSRLGKKYGSTSQILGFSTISQDTLKSLGYKARKVVTKVVPGGAAHYEAAVGDVPGSISIEQLRTFGMRNQEAFQAKLRQHANKLLKESQILKGQGEHYLSKEKLKAAARTAKVYHMLDNPRAFLPVHVRIKEVLKDAVRGKLVVEPIVREELTAIPKGVVKRLASRLQNVQPVDVERRLQHLLDQTENWTKSVATRKIMKARASVAKKLRIAAFGKRYPKNFVGPPNPKDWKGIITPVENRIKRITIDDKARRFIKRRLVGGKLYLGGWSKQAVKPGIKKRALRAAAFHKVKRANPTLFWET